MRVRRRRNYATRLRTRNCTRTTAEVTVPTTTTPTQLPALIRLVSRDGVVSVGLKVPPVVINWAVCKAVPAATVAAIAEAMKGNPELATAFVEFEDRAASAGDANMPYTLADATTEVQTEAFLADPIGSILDIDFEKVLNPSEWGKDMTDDQREKAQEVVIPVIIASNIVAAAMTRRI